MHKLFKLVTVRQANVMNSTVNSTQLLTNYQNVMLYLSLATSVLKLDPIGLKIRTAALKQQIKRDIRHTALGRHY